MAKRRRRRKPAQIEHTSDDEEVEPCRCVCGNHDANAKRPWVQCIACSAWQHNDCMDHSVFSDELEADYLCEECHPDDHAGLVAAIAKGETPWVARTAERLRLKAELEQVVLDAVQGVDWFWPTYGPFGPNVVVAGTGDAIRKSPPPADYLRVLRDGLRLLFDEMPMTNLRNLAAACDGVNVSDELMRTLRRTAARLYAPEDAKELGVLAEIFGWFEEGKDKGKGRYWAGYWAVLEQARKNAGV